MSDVVGWESIEKHYALQKHTEIFQPKFLSMSVPRGTFNPRY